MSISGIELYGMNENDINIHKKHINKWTYNIPSSILNKNIMYLLCIRNNIYMKRKLNVLYVKPKYATRQVKKN